MPCSVINGGFYLLERNMVVALKELSIRGDFRTTVEYLIKLLETESFQSNEIDTGWLDHLIAEKVQVGEIGPYHLLVTFCGGIPTPLLSPLQAEKPDTMLGVVCGALNVADAAFRTCMTDFLHSLERCRVGAAHVGWWDLMAVGTGDAGRACPATGSWHGSCKHRDLSSALPWPCSFPLLLCKFGGGVSVQQCLRVLKAQHILPSPHCFICREEQCFM